jgi:hypothetical protein
MNDIQFRNMALTLQKRNQLEVQQGEEVRAELALAAQTNSLLGDESSS